MNLPFVRTEPGEDPIVVEGYFAAAPALVFQAWTDPDIVIKWFGRGPNTLHSASIDLRLGGAWRFVLSKDEETSVAFEGEYLDIEHGERLVFTWSHVVARTNGKREATPYSRVEVNFAPKGSGTDVRLVHSAVLSEDARRGIGGGWETSFSTMSVLLSSSEGT